MEWIKTSAIDGYIRDTRLKDTCLGILFIRAGDVTDGDLAAVSLDGENHVGNVWRTKERLCITPRSPHYKSKIFAGEDLTRAHVVGAVVGWTHWRKVRRPMEENSGKGKEENKQ